MARPSGSARPAPMANPTATRYRLPTESTINSPEKAQASQLLSAAWYGCSGSRYSIHLPTTASGDGSTCGLTQPSEVAACHSTITSAGTMAPTRPAPARCQEKDAAAIYFTPRVFLAATSRSVRTQSWAVGTWRRRPTPVLSMVSAVTWMCSGVMS